MILFSIKEFVRFCYKTFDKSFLCTKISQDFLGSDPETWPQLQDYNSAKKIDPSVLVVNDCTEHAVKLASVFDMSITQDEKQRQLIFQVLEHQTGEKTIEKELKKI